MNNNQSEVIFIIDDSQINIKIISKFLKDVGFQVLTAENGKTGIEQVEKVLPDLILLDVLMPEMDGFEVGRRLQENPVTHDIPIIFMTALADPVEKVKGLTLGAVDYITKPFQYEEVLARINVHLKIRNLSKQLENKNQLLQHEIREHELSESALRRSEAKFASVFRSSPDPIAITSLNDYILLDINQSFCNFTGYQREDILGQSWQQLLMWQDQELLTAIGQKIEQKQVISNQEVNLITNDGVIKTVLLSAEMIGFGQETCTLFLLRDITDRKKMEESLKMKDFAMSSALSAIAISDLAGNLTYINQSFLQMWGYHQAEEIIGQTVSEFWHEPADAKHIIDALWEEGKWFGELKGKKRDGKLFDVQLSASLVKNNLGQPICLMASFIDITERNQQAIALQKSEQRLRRIITTSTNGLLVVNLQGCVLFVNPAAENILGRKAEKILGEWIGLPISGEKTTEIAIHHPDGILKFADMQVVEIPWQDETAYLASLNDITARKQAEEKLKILSEASQQSPASIVITDSEGNIEYVNPKFEQVTGYSAAEVIGKNPRILKSGYTTIEEYEQMWQTIISGKEWHGEFHNKKKNGDLFWEKASISPIKNDVGEITHFVAVKEDITEHKHNEALLLHQANYDALTNLPNRFLVVDRLKQAINQAERTEKRIAVMFVDLDHFKKVNDTLGHEMGDLLLMLTAQRLIDCLRKSDTVARLGGDEFLIIINDLDNYRQCEHIAAKIIDILEQPFDLCGDEAFISASIGITVYPDDGIEIGILMRNADTAMYGAKAEGRNGYTFFTPSMNAAAQLRIGIENHLRYALKRDELYLVYQPFVELTSGNIVGAEALLRWCNPELGHVSPDQFIPIAEETGLISELGKWVLEQACDTASQWQQYQPLLKVSVNVSPRQFRDLNFAEMVNQTLINYNLPPNCLELELTERLLIENVPGAIDLIYKLHQMNVFLSLDDFGTGYSSLSYLKTYHFSVLKIDKSFIHDLPNNEEAVSVVKAIIAMAHGLKLEVIAEGVETEEQLQFLMAENCDYAQGYLLGKPILPEEFQVSIQEQNYNYLRTMIDYQSHHSATKLDRNFCFRD